MTTLAWTLWAVYMVLAVAGAVFIGWMGDWAIAAIVGIVLGLLAGLIHYALV